MAKKAGAGAYVDARKLVVAEGQKCFLRHITHTSRAVVAYWDKALKPAGLTGNQFHVLSVLAATSEMNVKGLAQNLGMDPTTVTRAVQPLIRDGLVASRANPDDTRQRILNLTKLGKQKFTRAVPLWEKVQMSVLNHFGTADWEEMTAGLKRIRASLDETRQNHY